MSTITTISGLTGSDYATQLAQTSALRRGLFKLGTAVDKGDMTAARAQLTALIKANPQYAVAAGSAGSESGDAIVKDFDALTKAIASNQPNAAQSAWTQVKKDLAEKGVASLGDGTAATSKLLAEQKATSDQQIIKDALGLHSTSSQSAASTVAGALGSSSQTGLGTGLLNQWLTYRFGGVTSPFATGRIGIKLDTAA